MGLPFKHVIVAAGLVLLSGHKLAAAAPTYKVVDLGTLGADYSSASRVNDSNQVTGESSTDGSISRSFLYADGMIDVVGVFNFQSRGLGINDLGQVVGDAAFDRSNFTAYIAGDGSMQNIGTLGGPSSQAQAINNRGVIVGWSHYAQPPSGPWTWPAHIDFDQRHHAFVYQNGVMQDLHVLAGLQGDNSVATCVNDNGHIIGMIDRRGFLFANGQLTEFESNGARRVAPLGINNGGLVVLYVDDAAGNATAFTYQDDHWTPLGSLGGGESVGRDVNESNEVVGSSTTGEIREFVFSPVLSPELNTTSMTSNASTKIEWNGDVVLIPHVGVPVWGAPVWHAFIYKDGQMTDLNTLIPANSGWELTHAGGINNAGVIVGTGEFNGHSRAYMLIPIPEPSSLTMALMFFAALAAKSCRCMPGAGSPSQG